MDDTSADLSPRVSPRVPAFDSWPAHVATALATGVATAAMPVQRWSPAARWGMHGGMGALAGAGTALVMRNPGLLPGLDDARKHGRDDDRQDAAAPVPSAGPVLTAGLALLTAAAVAGVSRGGQAFDTRAERALVKRGVRRPRLWMGVAAAGASLAMSAVERRRTAREPATAPVPPPA